jgi:hypothetical protein
MPFSVLLLTAASSKRSISGYRDSKVVMNGQLQSDEVILFFQIDRDEVRSGLDMLREGMKCCDGLVFRSHDNGQKIICLVELKSEDMNQPEDQIISTRRHLEQLLAKECRLCSDYLRQITWKACIYRHTASQTQTAECSRKLRAAGFSGSNITFVDRGQNDIGRFLRGEADNLSNRGRR